MVKNPPANAGDVQDRFTLWVRKILWSRKWQPTPVFLSGKSHGQRSQVGYSPWGRKRVKHELKVKRKKNLFMSSFNNSFRLDSREEM